MRIPILFVATVALAGCLEEQPIGEASYAMPTTGEALDAILAGLKADRIDNPNEVDEVGIQSNHEHYSKSPVGSMKAVMNKARDNANKNAIRMYDELKRVGDLTCEWKRFPYKTLPKWMTARVVNPPVAAYKCKYSQLYNKNYAMGNLANPWSEGYFYRKGDDDFIYIGRYRHPFP